MKFSVDINMQLNGIRGWVSDPDGAQVKLYKDNVLLGNTKADIYRPDVHKAGLCSSAVCGFSFSEADYDLKTGDIYRVEIHAANKVYAVNRLYGNPNELLDEFVRFELLPRDDLSYLASKTEDILQGEPTIFAFKRLMIRLRRGKRGKNHAVKFVGYQYESMESDFAIFRKMVEEYLEVWLSFLDTRCLWSLVDTFADYGKPVERISALAISNFMHAERMHQTQHCLYDFNPKNESNRVINHQLKYWGGMKTNQLREDDSLDVFLARNLEILDCVPFIKTIFIEVLRRSSKEPTSLLGFNLANSDYFSKRFEYFMSNYFR